MAAPSATAQTSTRKPNTGSPSTANYRLHATTGQRPIDLMAQEALTPLSSIAPFAISELVPRKAGFDGFVRFVRSRHSLPPDYAGQSVLIGPRDHRIVDNAPLAVSPARAATSFFLARPLLAKHILRLLLASSPRKWVIASTSPPPSIWPAAWPSVWLRIAWPASSKKLTRPKLLITNEVGYLTLEKTHAGLLFQAICERNERCEPIILTSNKAFAGWAQVFADDNIMASAALDRLLHCSTVLNIRGDIYRLKEKLLAKSSGNKVTLAA